MEIEIKLALAPALAARLRRHPLLRGITPLRRQLKSLYFDTPGFDLLHRRIALRVRRVGRIWIQTLKAEVPMAGTLSTRPEWEMRVSRPMPNLALLPPEARAMLAGIAPALLAPVFVTEFRRTAWLLDYAGAQVELALDLGQVRAGAASRTISEIEIELRTGPVDALHALAGALLEQLPLGCEPRSKAARGYALAGATRPAPVKVSLPDPRPDQAAGAVWCAALGAALTQFSANLPGYLETPEDLEYLHQLRVATRRLRALASLAPSLGLAHPAWLEALRSLMARLNPARDWDVFLDEVLPAALQALADAPLDAALQTELQARARQARGEAQAALADADATRLVLAIERTLAHPPAIRERADSWAGRAMDKRWRRLRKGAVSFGRLDAAGRHALRLQAKKLRYAAEVFAPMAGHCGQAFMAALSGLQDALGTANDVVVARQLLSEITRDSPGLSFEAGRLAGTIAALHKPHGEERIGELLRIKPFWREPPTAG